MFKTCLLQPKFPLWYISEHQILPLINEERTELYIRHSNNISEVMTFPFIHLKQILVLIKASVIDPKGKEGSYVKGMSNQMSSISVIAGHNVPIFKKWRSILDGKR